MAIIKNEIPILEFDDCKSAVINPNHECFDMYLPEKCVFAFVGDYIYDYAKKNNAKLLGNFYSATKTFPVYAVDYKGEKITLCQAPVGAAPSAQLLDWLISYGVKKIISSGSCGCLVDFPEKEFLIPIKALRDEGTSYHYMPPSRYVEINKNAIGAIKEALAKHSLPIKEIITWSTDGFYRETQEKVAYRREEGCSAVEMEASALAACANMREAEWGIILYTADSLANAEEYDMRSFGGNAYEYALTLCLDALINL